MNEFKNYTRTPIFLSNQTIAVLEIFECHGTLQDIWKHDFVSEQTWDDYKKAAIQFVKQFEGSTCPAFEKSLSVELAKQYYEFCKSTKQLGFWEDFKNEINNIENL